MYSRLLIFSLILGCSGAKDDSGADDSGADDSGLDDSGDSGPAFDCPLAETALQEITTTPAAPYYVHHPAAPAADAPIIVFLGGGPGDRGSATLAFNGFLARGSAIDDVWAVLPYADDGGLSDEGDRVVAVVDEILDCYGGDANHVHLAGTSNGGRAAFSIMLEYPARFATLLGAPGYFVESDESTLSLALEGKAVLNGVGETDTPDWHAAVEGTHETLVSLGIESYLEEFPGQGHVPDGDFDPEPLYGFWLSH